MPVVDGVRAWALSVPADEPEQDGTLEWDKTGVLVVEVEAGGVTGLGWSYTAGAPARAIVAAVLAPALDGLEADDVPAAWMAMRRAVRNDGDGGLCATALSACDVALWDRLARARELPLAVAAGAFRDAVPGYGSGGFCNYDDATLAAQVREWAQQGFKSVKMKVGADPARDPERVRVVRDAVGPAVDVMVDANGAWPAREAVARVRELDEAAGGIVWVEEPVSSRDHDGLAFVRAHVPPHVAVAAGEYLNYADEAARLLRAGAVDVLQADVTRCGGVTGFRAIAAVAAAHGVPLSAHCSPALHAHTACTAERLLHVECFHDHTRLEALVFDGVPQPGGDGLLRFDRAAAGHGMALKAGALERFGVDG